MVTHRVTCTWWLPGLALKGPWLGPGAPPPDLNPFLRIHWSQKGSSYENGDHESGLHTTIHASNSV